MDAKELIDFENEVARKIEAKEIAAPVHLGGGNEEHLIRIFADIKPTDWVFCSYRQHYHALLHGIPRERVMAEIVAGRSMTMCFPKRRFYSSAIVAGQCSIATGVAYGVKDDSHVWCFIGDMGSTTGAFHEAQQYARGRDLPITFIIEDNGLSCDSPTTFCWGSPVDERLHIRRYRYERTRAHIGAGKLVHL